MVQAWYQGGISVFDWTDAAHPKEIAFFDRGPVDSTRMASGGSWSVYWYNGVIVSSEIARGLDIFELTPSAFISQNEIDAAKTVHLDYLNAQGQPSSSGRRASRWRARTSISSSGRRVWTRRRSAMRAALASAEKASGADRQKALTDLAGRLDQAASDSKDGAKVRMVAGVARQLAGESTT